MDGSASTRPRLLRSDAPHDFASGIKLADEPLTGGGSLAAFRPEEAQPLWVRVRIALLEERLDTLPARDRDDVLARVSWMQEAMLSEYPRPIAQDEACLAQLRQDIETGAVLLPERAP